MPYSSQGSEALPAGYGAYAHPHPCLTGENLLDGTHELQNLASDSVDNLPLPLGTTVQLTDGRVFKYVRMNVGTAALGSVLERAAEVGEDTVSSSSDLLSIETGGVDTTWVAGDFVGDWVYVDAGTGEGQCRRIISNTTTTLRLDRPLTTALAVADSDITIIRPYRMILATAAVTTPVAGISVGTITAVNATPDPDVYYHGWMQTAGFCEHILLDDTASVEGQYLVVDDATAGKARGIGATVDVEDQRFFGIAAAANVSDTIPGWLTACLG